MSLDFYLYDKEGNRLFQANITHNLAKMANAADIYQTLWRPEELGIRQAHECIPRLKQGLLWLIEHKKEAEQYNSPNGWGMYEHFVPFVTEVLTACYEYPTAFVEISR